MAMSGKGYRKILQGDHSPGKDREK